MSVLGIDVSSRAVDLVILDDDTAYAEWHRIPLDRPAWASCRSLRSLFPSRSWFEDAGITVAAIEDPFSDRYQAAKQLGRITGAVLALIPLSIRVLEPIPPHAWRRVFLGTAKADKDAARDRLDELWPAWRDVWTPELRRHHPRKHDIPPDPIDAYAVAWTARELHDRKEA